MVSDSPDAVSVVIPTRSRPQMLSRAIEKVLGQDYPGAINVLVVFDQAEPHEVTGPTGPGRTITVISNTRTPGLAGARNTGYLRAQDPYLAVCDDDDEWHQGKLAGQVRLLKATPEAMLATSGIRIDFEGRITERPLRKWRLTFEDFLHDRQMEVHPSTYLARTEQVREQIGLVNEEIPGGYAEDYEWLLRAARLGPVVGLPSPMTTVNWHNASFFADRWKMIDDALAWLVREVPEFAQDPVGLGRIQGQRAFATAALGDRKLALARVRATLRNNPRAKQAWAAIPVALGLVSADQVLTLGRRVGRGI